MDCRIAYLDKDKTAKKKQHRVAGPNLIFLWNPDQILGQLKEFKPDLVFINKGDAMNDIKFIQSITSSYRTAYWYGDWRNSISEYVYAWASNAGVAFFNVDDKPLRFQLKQMGQKNIFTVHQGADPLTFKPLEDVEKKYDIGFGANFYGRRSFENSGLRIDVVRFLRDKGYNICVVGEGWPADIPCLPHKTPIELNKFYNECRITIGISHYTNVKYGVSNRLYQCMAVGVPHVNWFTPGMNELFDNDKDTGQTYIEVKNYSELIKEIDKLLNDDIWNYTIGGRQRNQIIKYHTFECAWQRIENYIKRIYPELN
jgi:spore maturation protein CgeB